MHFKYILWTALIMLSGKAFAQSDTKIQGNIKGLTSDSLYILSRELNRNSPQKWDTSYSENNRFSISLPITSLTELLIIPKKMVYYFAAGRKYIPSTGFIDLTVLPGDSLNIRGAINEGYLQYLVEGSSLNNRTAALRSSYKDLDKRAVSFELQMAELPEDSNRIRKSKALFSQRVHASGQISQIKKNYIQSHPLDNLSALLLLKQPINSFGDLYLKLSDSVRNGPLKDALKNQYHEYLNFIKSNDNAERLKAGSKAPEFNLSGVNGEQFHLSSLKHKTDVIVIDFWGSWCGWCIKEFPKMKSYYERYKKRITFIGIACNDTPGKWKLAVEKYALPWINVINDSVNDVSVQYGIQAYPTKIILNKDLQITGIFKGADPEFFNKLDELLH